MGLVSNDLKNIVDKLGDAKKSINAKYGTMRANNTTSPQADLEHLYINELSPSIDKIECLNTYGGIEVDPEKILEGTIVFSQGKAIVGTMPNHGNASTTLYEGNSVLRINKGYYEDGEVAIQFQEKTVIPSSGLQVVEPDHGHVLSRVFVDGINTQKKTVRPKTESQSVTPDFGLLLDEVLVEGDADLKAENIKPGVEIFGVTGAMPAMNISEILDVSKTSVNIPAGYSDGTGSVKIQLQQKTVTPGTSDKAVTPDSQYVLEKVTVKGDPDLKAENIKPGVEIFGVTGSMPSNTKAFKLNKSLTTDESPAGYYANKITAEITDYDIVYVANITGQSAIVQSVTHGSPFNISSDTPSHNNGSQFLGWSESATATAAQYTAGQRISNSLAERGTTLVLYAVWQSLNTAPAIPTINMIPVVENNTVKEGRNVSFTATSTDPEGDSVSYEWMIDNETATPSARDYSVGTHTVKCRAKDSHGAYSDWSSILTFVVKAAPSIMLILYDPSSNGGDGTFDVHAQVINTSEIIITTFNNKGYATVVRVDDTADSGESNTMTSAQGTYNGVNVVRSSSYSEETNYVTTTYTIRNTASAAKYVSLGVHADVMIGSNDRAAIMKNNTGLLLKDGDNDHQFYIYTQNMPGVTDADTRWIGPYDDRADNVWNESTVDSIASGTESTGIDTGMAFSWKNMRLSPGETKTLTFILNVE